MIDVTCCPVCKSENKETWCEIEARENARLIECGECGAVYLNRIMDEEEIRAAYGPDYYLSDDKPDDAQKVRRFGGPIEFVLRSFRGRRAGFVNRVIPPGPILDVGCGRGLMLALLKKRHSRSVAGIQLSTEIAARIRAEHQIEIHEKPLPEAGLPEAHFSGVTLWHVLEHVGDPIETLSTAHRILTPEGRLVLEIPNLDNPLTDSRPERWFEIDFPNHCMLYTPKSLRALLDRTGFEVERSSHFNLEFSVFCVLQTILNRVCRERDVLYDLLRRKKTTYLGHPLTGWLKIKHLVLAMILGTPAFLLSAYWAARKRGEILRVVCRKKVD